MKLSREQELIAFVRNKLLAIKYHERKIEGLKAEIWSYMDTLDNGKVKKTKRFLDFFKKLG